MIVALDDDEIAAAIQKSGWVLSTKESVREFRGLANALAEALARKNSELNPVVYPAATTSSSGVPV